jgi:hypothetical protein
MDIAGTAMPASGVGMGYGVRTLERLIADNYELDHLPHAKPKKNVSPEP